MNENGFYRVDDREYFREILGYGSAYLIEKALIFPYNHIYDKNLTDEILAYYLKRYNENPSYLTKPYDGIVELLKKLKEKGYTLVAYSNKPDDVLQGVIRDILGEDIFDYSLGFVKGAKGKPDPSVLLEILEKFDVEPKEAIYIGDSEVDIETGKNANVKTIAVSWGFRNREFLESNSPDYLVDSVEELKEILESLE